MEKDLTLPGDIPGLLRTGSVVVAKVRVHGAETNKGTPYCEAGVQLTVVGLGTQLGVESAKIARDRVYTAPLSDLVLDLSNVTSRVHALWWLRDLSTTNHRALIVYCNAPTEILFCEELPLTRLATFWADCLTAAGRA